MGVASIVAPTKSAMMTVRTSGWAASIVRTPIGQNNKIEVMRPGENRPRFRMNGKRA